MKLSVSIVLVSTAAALVGCQQPQAAEAQPALHSLERRARPQVIVVAAAKAGSVTTPSKVVVDDQQPRAEVDLDAELQVKRLIIAKDVENREPVEPASAFATTFDGPIYAFVEVGNRDRVASEVYVSFIREGGIERGPITLRVGPAPRWRTWANTRLAKQKGTWFAVVRDASGKELARREFEITGEEAPVPAV